MWNSCELPRAGKSCRKLVGIAKGCQELSSVAANCKKLSSAARRYQEMQNATASCSCAPRAAEKAPKRCHSLLAPRAIIACISRRWMCQISCTPAQRALAKHASKAVAEARQRLSSSCRELSSAAASCQRAAKAASSCREMPSAGAVPQLIGTARDACLCIAALGVANPLHTSAACSGEARFESRCQSKATAFEQLPRAVNRCRELPGIAKWLPRLVSSCRELPSVQAAPQLIGTARDACLHIAALDVPDQLHTSAARSGEAHFDTHCISKATAFEKLPRAARNCQKLSEAVKRCRELPEIAKGCQALQCAAASCQKLPGAVRSCRELPDAVKAGKSCREQPRAARRCYSCQELPGAVSSCHELPNVIFLSVY